FKSWTTWKTISTGVQSRRWICADGATKKPASPPAFLFQSANSFRASVRRFQCRGFLLRDRALDRRLHLLEGADLDLAHALARHAELGREIFQRHRLVGKATGLEDAAFARVQHAHGAMQGIAAVIVLLAFRHDGFL